MPKVCSPSPSVLKLSNTLPFYPPVNPGICKWSKTNWAHNSSFTPFPAWVCFSCTLTCLKTKLKGLTSYLQLFEIDVYEGQFLIEFLMAVCLSLIILFSHPSANFKRNVRKKQRPLDYEMPAGFLKTDILSVQDMKQETSLTPVKEHCRKKIILTEWKA